MNYIILPILAAISYVGLFLCYKIGERNKVNGTTLNLGLFLCSATIFLAYSLLTKNINKDPLLISIGFIKGFFFTSLTVIIFLKSLKYGKLNTSTIILNLSFIIPIILSIFIWAEIPDLKKIIGLLFGIVSIILIKENEK